MVESVMHKTNLISKEKSPEADGTAVSCSYLPFACLWLFIVVPKTIAAVLYAVMLVWMLATRKRAKQPSEYFKSLFILLIAATVIYLVSIIRAMVVDLDAERLVAAFGTLLYWLLGLGYLFYYSTCHEVSWLAVSKRMAFSMLVLAVILLSYYVAGSSLPRVFGRAVSSVDYLSSGVTTRLNAFMEYPTLVAVFVLITYGAAVYWTNQKWGFIGTVALSAIGVLSIQAASSRAGIFAVIALVMAGVVYSAYSSSQKVRHYFIALGVLFALGAIVIFAFFGPSIAHAVYEIINSRSGSTGGRLYIYTESVSMTLSDSPIIGMGVKYASSLSNDAPFGSHSTWIGFFYKTGFVGLALYAVLFFQIFRMQLRRAASKNSYEVFLAISLAILYCYLFVEDLDATAWICVLFFSLFAVRMNCSEAKQSEVYHG